MLIEELGPISTCSGSKRPTSSEGKRKGKVTMLVGIGAIKLGGDAADGVRAAFNLCGKNVAVKDWSAGRGTDDNTGDFES
jgi:hypothetical protein